MSNIINKIRLSGTDYTLSATSSGGASAVEVTQAEYDALVSGGTVDPNTFYIITDGEMFNPSGKVDTSAFTEFSGAVETELSGKTDESAFTAHTGDSTIHVTTAQTAAWNAKSDFSGSYNDLTDKPTIPTVPTSNTAFTNDAGYITEDAISGKADSSAVTEEISAAVSGKVDTSTYNTYTAATDTALGGKQATLVSGTNIKTINNESILGSGNINIQGGGGKAIEAGRGISITTGETADTVSFNLPISAGTGTNSIIFGDSKNEAKGVCAFAGGSTSSVLKNEATKEASFAFGKNCKATGNYSHAEGFIAKASGENSHAEGNYTTASGASSHVEGNSTVANGTSSHAEGSGSKANGDYSHAEGSQTSAMTNFSHAEGQGTIANNQSEHASGQYNISNKVSTTFGDSGNTLFSVGNGTSSARHNAFEIRQNGDIYLSLNGQDVKLQDQLGGGGSSINVVQTTGTSTTDVMSQDAVTTQLSGYVTTDTVQTISGRKIFTYTALSGKAIEFKQTNDSAKVGFSIKNPAETNNEVATFEFRPNTFTIDNVRHPLLYFGHYRNTNVANAGVPQTVIGFRQYDQKNAAAYHYLMPLPEKAKTPFNLTTSFKDYYAPMGFKNGSTMITADNTGVVDLSSELDGLKLKKLTQSEYDSLSTKDNSTLYVIVN